MVFFFANNFLLSKKHDLLSAGRVEWWLAAFMEEKPSRSEELAAAVLGMGFTYLGQQVRETLLENLLAKLAHIDEVSEPATPRSFYSAFSRYSSVNWWYQSC